jgi:RecA-family ATPase
MIDTAADVYGGNEIDRSQTTQFVKLMNGIAVAGGCSVSILAHPSVSGMNTGTGISGSTAWHNKVRARAYMRPVTEVQGEEPSPDTKVIEFMKNNYGKQGDSVSVRWQRGVYVPESKPGSLEQMAKDQEVDFEFLRLLQQFENQERNLSDKEKAAKSYAPRAFSEVNGKKISERQYEKSMQRLFEASKIHIEHYGPPSRGWTKLALGPRPE